MGADWGGPAARAAEFEAGRRHEAYLSLLCFLTTRGNVGRNLRDRLGEASLAELSLLRLELFAASDPLAAARRFAACQPQNVAA